MKNTNTNKAKKFIAAGLLLVSLVSANACTLAGTSKCCEHPAHSQVQEGVEATVVEVDGKMCLKIGDKIVEFAPSHNMKSVQEGKIYLSNLNELKVGDQIKLWTVPPTPGVMTGLPPMTHWVNV